MPCFNYDIAKTNQRLIVSKLVSLGILILPFIIDQFYDLYFVKLDYLYLILMFFLVTLIIDLAKTQVYKISFAGTDKKVRFYGKTLLGKTKTKELLFEEIRLDIFSRKRKGIRKIYRIDFQKGNKSIESIYTNSN